VLDAGEQCDDGNQVSGDTCPSNCSYSASRSLIRGNRRKPARDRDGCQIEWYAAGANRLDNYGGPNREQTCEAGDPTCDFNANTPGVCEFQVVVCLNNNDPSLPACTPNGISSVVALSPRPGLTSSPVVRGILAGDLAALQYALAHLLDPTNPATGYDYAPPLAAAQQNVCSAPFAIDVPVDTARRRSQRRVALTTRSTDNSFPRTRLDVSQLGLTCKWRRQP
jgi:cysteine-rich repeat protein